MTILSIGIHLIEYIYIAKALYPKPIKHLNKKGRSMSALFL